MDTVRWIFTDPGTNETWTHPINPITMSSPFQMRSAQHAAGVRTGTTAPRTVLAGARPVEWTFGGAIRTQAHHDALVAWKRHGVIRVTDHLNRTFAVVPQGLEITERKPTPTNTTRYRYVMKTMLLRQETP